MLVNGCGAARCPRDEPPREDWGAKRFSPGPLLAACSGRATALAGNLPHRVFNRTPGVPVEARRGLAAGVSWHAIAKLRTSG